MAEIFPHRILLSKSYLKFKDLDEETKELISDLEASIQNFSGDKSSIKYKALLKKSEIIGQHIYINFVDDSEVEVTIEQTEEKLDNIDEMLLKSASKAPQHEPEPEPQPTPQPQAHPTFSDNNEKALYLLYMAGIRKDITRDILKQYKFDIGFWTPLGKYGTGWIGNYKLARRNIDENFTLIKK